MLEPRGSSSESVDNAVLIPYTNARRAFQGDAPDFTVSVKVSRVGELDEAVQEAIGQFRVARNLGVRAENNFKIEQSDEIARSVTQNLWYVRIATYLIGFITLLGAAVGLMNIMLVSVKERTQEIGIRKALGATSKAVQSQFLAEAIVISQLGGFIGIVLGLIAGNSITLFFGDQFSLPWGWAIGGFVICLIVGVMAGYYPAKRAAALNPIESLRYE
jgi:putative ABC transport system permease protein